jgi:hypothetical protein
MTPSTQPPPSQRVVLPISGVHRGVVNALEFARSMTDQVTAVYIELDPAATEHVREQWQMWGQGVPLVVLPSPYHPSSALLEYLERTDREHDDGQKATWCCRNLSPPTGGRIFCTIRRRG